MNLENKNLILQIQDNQSGVVICEHEIQLLEFQRKTLENKEISFFYTFKDAGVELDSLISSKIKYQENDSEFVFLIKYLDEILYKLSLSITGLNEDAVQKNEVELYFIFEKVSKMIVAEILEEHKKMILSNIENS
jgi:hypothetical protein